MLPVGIETAQLGYLKLYNFSTLYGAICFEIDIGCYSLNLVAFVDLMSASLSAWKSECTLECWKPNTTTINFWFVMNKLTFRGSLPLKHARQRRLKNVAKKYFFHIEARIAFILGCQKHEKSEKIVSKLQYSNLERVSKSFIRMKEKWMKLWIMKSNGSLGLNSF